VSAPLTVEVSPRTSIIKVFTPTNESAQLPIRDVLMNGRLYEATSAVLHDTKPHEFDASSSANMGQTSLILLQAVNLPQQVQLLDVQNILTRYWFVLVSCFSLSVCAMVTACIFASSRKAVPAVRDIQAPPCASASSSSAPDWEVLSSDDDADEGAGAAIHRLRHEFTKFAVEEVSDDEGDFSATLAEWASKLATRPKSPVDEERITSEGSTKCSTQGSKVP